MWLHRYTKFLAFATFLLIIAGGLVTSNDYGLAVPDWPKSYGMWMPPMIGGVLYEHGHRMIAAFVGFLTVILAIWMLWKESRKWMRALGVVALFAVILQGVLGGLTVIYLLPTPISVMHATLAQTFFSLIVSLVLFTSPQWKRPLATATNHRTPALFTITTIAIYLQLILGAWMRHSKAALAIPDFPLAFGRIIPEFTNSQIAIHFSHRIGALLVFTWISVTAFVVLRKYKNIPEFVHPALLLLGLVFVQITLGAFTIWTQTAVWAATSHVGVGALMLATAVRLTVQGFRTRAPFVVPSTEMDRNLIAEPAI